MVVSKMAQIGREPGQKQTLDCWCDDLLSRIW